MFLLSVCSCVEISVVLSYYVLRFHYIIELARGGWGRGRGADSTCEVAMRNSG